MDNSMLRIKYLLFRKEALLKVIIRDKTVYIHYKVLYYKNYDESFDTLTFDTVAEAEDAMGEILHEMNKKPSPLEDSLSRAQFQHSLEETYAQSKRNE